METVGSLTASEIGRLGGRSRSERKRKAVRENGKLGGRPIICKICKQNKATKGFQTCFTCIAWSDFNPDGELDSDSSIGDI